MLEIKVKRLCWHTLICDNGVFLSTTSDKPQDEVDEYTYGEELMRTNILQVLLFLFH